MVNKGIYPCSFDGEKPGDMFVFFWPCEVDFLMCGVEVTTDDDILILCFEVVSIGEELVVKIKFVLESCFVFF
jgi:hypothetical protein